MNMTDKDLLKISKDFAKGVLGGNDPKNHCFYVASALGGYLSFGGLKCDLIEGEIDTGDETWNHFWLQLPDGRILDPTASQFTNPDGSKMPTIFLGEKPEWYKEKTQP